MEGTLISLAEYAALHGLKPDTINHRIKRGLHPEAVKIGRNWAIPRDAELRPDKRKKDPRR